MKIHSRIDDDDDDMGGPSSTIEYKTSPFSTPKTSNRSRRTTIEAYSAMQCTTPQGTPSKRLSYFPIQIANTTPKPAKGAKYATRLAIMDKPQEVRVTGRDIQKTVPTVDTDRLKKRQMSIAGLNESVILECPTESPSVDKKGDLFCRLKNETAPILAKQLDTSF